MSLSLQQIIYQDIERHSIFNLFVFNSYFESTFGSHYPKDIIFFINNLFLGLLQLKIFCGGANSMILTDSNEIYVWGCNASGQLGIGDNRDRTIPHQLPLVNVKEVSFGGAHSIALTHSNEIYVWGNNKYGHLGLGDKNNRNTPQILLKYSRAKARTFPVEGEKIKQIVCGNTHSMALTYSNEIYIWGHNTSGQLGFGDDDQNSPRKLDLENVKEIFCGTAHSIALTYENEVYVWGHNYYGELGLGDNDHRYTPHKLPFPANGEKVKQIICGDNHSIAVTYSNEIYVWGSNESGELGLGHNDDQNTPQRLLFFAEWKGVKQIFSGYNHSMILTYENEVYVWGSNSRGQLGLGDTADRNTPQKLPLSNIKEIFCGGTFSMALTNSYEIYGWGSNTSGELGLGDKNNRNVPTKLEF